MRVFIKNILKEEISSINDKLMYFRRNIIELDKHLSSIVYEGFDFYNPCDYDDYESYLGYLIRSCAITLINSYDELHGKKIGDTDEIEKFITKYILDNYKWAFKNEWDEKACDDDDEALTEDLNRWFKEKWVNVGKKVKGKHPPCGRKEAEDGSYPKCRPSKKVSKETPKIAGSYSKEEKKSMTSQKRRAEKTHNKSGTGNEPKMTHFNENKLNILILKELAKFNKIIYEDEYGSVEETSLIPDNLLNEAEYQGRKVQLGKIMQGDVKKSKVYVKNDKGKVVKVNFGFGGKSAHGKRMVIKKNNPARRKSFRARMKCDTPGPRWKPRYWACRTW